MPRLAELQKRFHAPADAFSDQIITDETLVLDSRAHIRPAQLVESKFLTLLRPTACPATSQVSKRPKPR